MIIEKQAGGTSMKPQRTKARLVFAVAVLLGVSSVVGTARAVPLADLVDGASITVLDKRFFDWTLLDTSLSEENLAFIDVTALADQPGNPGLRFTVSQDVLTSADGSIVDLSFEFRVGAPGATIKDNSLALVDYEVAGSGAVSIFEDVYASGGNLLASKFVFADSVDQQLLDTTEFAGQQTLTIQKFIRVGTEGEAGDFAAIRVFDQRFSQTTVTEPAMLALLGIGLAGLALGGRRSSRRNDADL